MIEIFSGGFSVEGSRATILFQNFDILNTTIEQAKNIYHTVKRIVSVFHRIKTDFDLANSPGSYGLIYDMTVESDRQCTMLTSLVKDYEAAIGKFETKIPEMFYSDKHCDPLLDKLRAQMKEVK